MTEERKAAERLAFKFLCLLIVIAVFVWIVPWVWSMFSPFIIAIPLAAVLQPLIGFLQNKLKFKRGLASIIVVLVVTAVVLAILIWLFTFGIGQVSNIVNNSGDVEQLVAFSVQLATSLPYYLIYTSFLVMGLYFIANNYSEIRSHLPGGSRRNQDSNVSKLTRSALRSLSGYLRVQFTFGLMVWILSWIVLSLFHFRYAGITAFFMGCMELIPMIGSGLPYIIMSILQFLLGNPSTGLMLLCLTLGLQILRRLLEPKFMSDNIGITPLQSLIGMFAGMRIGGIIGLIGGPVMMSVLVGAFNSNLQGTTLRDIRCLISYFKERWKSEDPNKPVQSK